MAYEDEDGKLRRGQRPSMAEHLSADTGPGTNLKNPRGRSTIVKSLVEQVQRDMEEDQEDPIPGGMRGRFMALAEEKISKAPSHVENYPRERSLSWYQRLKQDFRTAAGIREAEEIETRNLEYPNSVRPLVDDPKRPH